MNKFPAIPTPYGLLRSRYQGRDDPDNGCVKGDLDGTTLLHTISLDRLTTRIVSCKSNLQLAYDCRVRHKKCRGILKHVLKSYDNRRYRQC